MKAQDKTESQYMENSKRKNIWMPAHLCVVQINDNYIHLGYILFVFSLL